MIDEVVKNAISSARQNGHDILGKGVLNAAKVIKEYFAPAEFYSISEIEESIKRIITL